MNIDLSKTKMPVPKDMKELADTYLKQLQSGRMENTGWVFLPDTWTDEALSDLQKTADAIAAKCTLFIVIGIGGSYLGAKAILDALGHSRKGRPQIRFAGYSLAGTQLRRIVTALQEQETCLCVISKSGTTMETLLAYSILKEQMFAKYGEAAKERIFVMTEPKDNPLRKDVRDFGFTAFDHPTDIGGRFSILSIVGLLPLAVAGIDIRALLQGAADIPVDRLADYACTRVLLQRSGKAVEVFTYFSTDLKSFGEWIRQLFGETEGKAGKGAYPACLCFTPDLHSIGQFLQQGLGTLLPEPFPDRVQHEGPGHSYRGYFAQSFATRTRAWSLAPSSVGASSTRAMMSATSRISSSRKPRVVRAGLPRRMPLVMKGERGSKGMVLRLAVILTSSRRV